MYTPLICVYVLPLSLFFHDSFDVFHPWTGEQTKLALSLIRLQSVWCLFAKLSFKHCRCHSISLFHSIRVAVSLCQWVSECVCSRWAFFAFLYTFLPTSKRMKKKHWWFFGVPSIHRAYTNYCCCGVLCIWYSYDFIQMQIYLERWMAVHHHHHTRLLQCESALKGKILQLNYIDRFYISFIHFYFSSLSLSLCSVLLRLQPLPMTNKCVYINCGCEMNHTCSPRYFYCCGIFFVVVADQIFEEWLYCALFEGLWWKKNNKWISKYQLHWWYSYDNDDDCTTTATSTTVEKKCTRPTLLMLSNALCFFLLLTLAIGNFVDNFSFSI